MRAFLKFHFRHPELLRPLAWVCFAGFSILAIVVFASLLLHYFLTSAGRQDELEFVKTLGFLFSFLGALALITTAKKLSLYRWHFRNYLRDLNFAEVVPVRAIAVSRRNRETKQWKLNDLSIAGESLSHFSYTKALDELIDASGLFRDNDRYVELEGLLHRSNGKAVLFTSNELRVWLDRPLERSIS